MNDEGGREDPSIISGGCKEKETRAVLKMVTIAEKRERSGNSQGTKCVEK
jgi:hypothetical protein